MNDNQGNPCEQEPLDDRWEEGHEQALGKLAAALVHQMVIARAAQKSPVYTRAPGLSLHRGLVPVSGAKDQHAEHVLATAARRGGVPVPDDAELDRRANEFLRNLLRNLGRLSSVGLTRQDYGIGPTAVEEKREHSSEEGDG